LRILGNPNNQAKMRNLLLLSFLIIGFTSCQKEEIEPQYSTSRMEAETKIDTVAVHFIWGSNQESFKALAFITIIGTDYKYTSPEVTARLEKPLNQNERQDIFITTPGLKPLQQGQMYGIQTMAYRSVKPSFPTKYFSTSLVNFEEENNRYRLTTGNGSNVDEIK
jgi:hypothetical protein